MKEQISPLMLGLVIQELLDLNDNQLKDENVEIFIELENGETGVCVIFDEIDLHRFKDDAGLYYSIKEAIEFIKKHYDN